MIDIVPDISGDTGKTFGQLLHLASRLGYSVMFVPFRTYDGLVKKDRIGIRQDLSLEEINYNLAHELAHVFLHYDKGEIKSTMMSDSEYRKYEEQADRAARLLLFTIHSRKPRL